MEVSEIPRQLDLRLHDRVALDEIELYAEVLTAVAASDRPLTRTELDAVLGVAATQTALRPPGRLHAAQWPSATFAGIRPPVLTQGDDPLEPPGRLRRGTSALSAGPRFAGEWQLMPFGT
jgi:hypothetical protein